MQVYSQNTLFIQVFDGESGARIEFGSVVTNEQSRTIEDGEFIDLDSQPSMATMVENSNLTSALLTLLNQAPSITLMENTSIANISYGPKTDEINLSEWPLLQLHGRQIAARLLVGADGPSSSVRSFAKIESRGWSYERIGVVATLRCQPTCIKPTAWQRFLSTGPIAHLPVFSHSFCELIK